MKFLPDDFNEDDLKKDFEEEFDMLCSINEPLHEKMKKIYDAKKIDVKKFTERTELARHYYYDFCREGYIPNMFALVSVCMGLNLGLPVAESLLAPTKFGFNYTNKVHCAYIYLLTHYQGLCIEDCNKILMSLGIDKKADLLGSFSADERE